MNHNEPLSIEVFAQNTHSQKDCGCLILHDVLLLYTRTHVTVIYIYYVCVPSSNQIWLDGKSTFSGGLSHLNINLVRAFPS